MLLTPTGEPADNIDRIMLLMMWVDYLCDKKIKKIEKFIIAGIGKPTLPINSIAIETAIQYWQQFSSKPNQIENQPVNNQLKKKFCN